MNVTESRFENRQLHMEDYLQMVSAEQKEYAEVFDYSKITEKSGVITDYWTDNLLDLILRKENLNKAYKQVKAHKGSGGIDGMQVDELLPYLRENQETLVQKIRDGRYKPNPVRRVEIPKETKGEFRKLGVPTVVDRVIPCDCKVYGTAPGIHPHRGNTDRESPFGESVTVPVVLTDDEVKRIYTYRAGCRTGIELRNAAMLMLGLRLGFRASDVVNLKIEDIDWKQRRISIIQEKTKHPLVLPLSIDAGNSLYSYLSSSRPKAENNHVFIRHKAPMSSGNVERIITKYADQVRKEHPEMPRRPGPHMLRRTRATGLYQDGVELELVSRILGHSSTQTTRIYATPSMKMMQEAMGGSIGGMPEEEPLWTDNEDELARICGLR